MNRAFPVFQSILNGQTVTAQIWSRNIAPSATPSASIGPNAILSPYTKKGLQSSGLSAPHLLAMACSAVTPTFLRYPGVLWRPFMAIAAMRFGKPYLPAFRNGNVCADAGVSSLRRDDFSVREAETGPDNDRVAFKARQFSQFNGFVPDAFNCDHSSNALIALLLAPTRPSTVLGKIPQIIVNTVKRVAIWARAHVVPEIRERMNPAVAYRDASPSIILKLFGSRIQASALHPLPHVVNRIGVLDWHGPRITPDASQHKRSKENS